MANLSENPQWVDGIYQIEMSDPVVGGPDGVSNRQAKELASRTSYLKKEQEKTGSDLATHVATVDPHTQYAPKANPTFTGMPKAPMPAPDSNSQQVATTAFVRSVGATKLERDQNGADILDRELFNRNLGSSRAYSSSIPIGGSAGLWTTAEFTDWLERQGAFVHAYWVCRGSWSYAHNKIISDTGCGQIPLAGSVVEVMGQHAAITIRVTTPSTTPSGLSDSANAQFTYVYNGIDYSPGWRRDYNTKNKPTAADIGVYSKLETDIVASAATTAANNAATAAANANTNANSRVPSGRKVNGRTLTADITLGAGDVGALPADAAAVAANRLATPRKINGVDFNGTTDISVDSDWSQIRNVPEASRDVAGIVTLGSSVNDNSQTVAATTQLVFVTRNIATNALAKANTALPAGGTAVAANKLATPRKINGVVFDGTTDIQLNLGISLKALAQFSTEMWMQINLTATNANTVTFTINDASRGLYIVPNQTQVVLCENNATAITVNGMSYTRFNMLGRFAIPNVPTKNADGSTTYTLTYPGHGIVVGQQKTVRLGAFVYRELGCTYQGQAGNQDGLMYHHKIALNSVASSINVPVIGYAAASVGDWSSTGVNNAGLLDAIGWDIFSRDNYGSNVSAFMSTSNLLLASTSFGSLERCSRNPMVTVMVYDF
ncbi:hypothetical protein LHL03_08640 [Pectobacterium carotovorum]|uniref:hypothetical protein n=1 Tax=Pectobacterium carotovorum TaxID=554 RepID=UPI001CC2027E|nr:hypothetical protein [Pectobacterium carotovorum]UCZ81177.1 hypothetical protein LHL03_08640 [Pectobacterium carotovorum]